MLSGGEKAHRQPPPCPHRPPLGERGSCCEGPSHPGRSMLGTQHLQQSICAILLLWSLLLSTDQLPAGSSKDKMGNTAAIQWRLMPEMSHTSEQLLPIRRTALNGGGAPLMTVIKEVKACVEGKKSFTPPLKPSSDSSFSPPFSLLTVHFAHVALIQNHSFMYRDLGSKLQMLRFATVSHIAWAAC